MNDSKTIDPARLLGDLDFVRGLAADLCRDPDEADDLAQDAIVRALGHGGDGVRDRRNWLATIVRNLAKNRWRGNVRRRAREGRADTSTHVPSAAEIAEREDLRRTLIELVMQLSAEFREVVLLRHYRGLDTKACARELGIPESTVRTRTRRALQRLQGELDRKNGGDRQRWLAAVSALAVPKKAAATVAWGPLAVAAVLMALVGSAIALWPPGDETVLPTASTTATATTASMSSAESADSIDEARSMRAASAREEVADASSPIGESGRPWTVDGVACTVQDRTPLAGALVRLFTDRIADPGSHRRELGSVATDDDGRFAFSLDQLKQLREHERSRTAVFVYVDAAGYANRKSHAVQLDRLLEWGSLGDVQLSPQNTSGRVVAADGSPLANARVTLVSSVGIMLAAITDEFGFYGLHLADQLREIGVFASHPEHGVSSTKVVPTRREGGARVPDLVVSQRLETLAGIVCHPNGQGVPGIAVKVVGEVTHYVAEMGTEGPYRIEAEVETKADGTFAFHDLPAGEFMLSCGEASFGRRVVLPGARAARIELPRGFVWVRAEDEHGFRRTLGQYAVYRWRGRQAERAAARYRNEGPSADLLATADRLTALARGGRIHGEPDTFVVVEGFKRSGWGPCYGACRIGPDRYSGSVTIAVQRPSEVGDLQIRVDHGSGDAGADVQRAVAASIKVARVPGPRAVPVALDLALADCRATSEILGDWFEVPADGVVRGLPAGPLVVDVCAADGTLCTRHRVVIGRDRVAEILAKPALGVTIQLEVVLPRLEADQVVHWHSPELYVERHADGRRDGIGIEGGDGRNIRFENGRCRVKVREALPAGRYTFRLTLPRLVRESQEGSRQIRHPLGRLRIEPFVVELSGTEQVVSVHPKLPE